MPKNATTGILGDNPIRAAAESHHYYGEKQMNKYHLENLSTGERFTMVASSKKSAHEIATADACGVPLEIFGEAELVQVESLAHTQKRILACLRAARCEIDEVTDQEAVSRQLRTAVAYLQLELVRWERH